MVISILDNRTNPDDPLVIRRSEFLRFYTKIIFSCTIECSELVYKWSIKKLNDSNPNQILQHVIIPENPSYDFEEFSILENTLEYGLFRIIFEVSGTGHSFNKIKSFYSRAHTYLKVVPTGLIVFAMRNGINSALIGYNQSIKFEPIKYSRDPDELSNMTKLEYKFYCRVVDKSLKNLYYINESTVDLVAGKKEKKFDESSCFSSFGI